MRFVLPVLILSLLFLPACRMGGRAEDPDVEVAKRAAVQIQALREGEAYDALAPDLAERFRRDASRLPASQRNRPVEVLGAALVRKGEGFSEVAVIVRVTPPGVAPLENRAFYRVQNGKVVRVFPAMP